MALAGTDRSTRFRTKSTSNDRSCSSVDSQHITCAKEKSAPSNKSETSAKDDVGKPGVTMEVLFMVMVVMLMGGYFFSRWTTRTTPQQKVTCRGLSRDIGSNALARELVSLLRSDTDTIRGVLIQRNDSTLRGEIKPLEECCGGEGVFSKKPFDTVESLKAFLSHPLHRGASSGRAKCMIYVLRVDHVKARSVANGLKELLDMKKLHGGAVIPRDLRALLVFATEKSRDSVKEELPHRVVHLLRSV